MNSTLTLHRKSGRLNLKAIESEYVELKEKPTSRPPARFLSFVKVSLPESTFSVLRDEMRFAFGDFRVERVEDPAPVIRTTKHKAIMRQDKESGTWYKPDTVKASETRRGGKSICPLNPNHFALKSIKDSVKKMSATQQALVHYQYGNSNKWEFVELLSKSMWFEFLSRMKKQGRKFRSKKVQTLKGMAYLSVQNYRDYLVAGKDSHSPSKIIELLKVSKHQWRRDWLPYWRLMKQILTEIDREVLERVYWSTR